MQDPEFEPYETGLQEDGGLVPLWFLSAGPLMAVLFLSYVEFEKTGGIEPSAFWGDCL